MIKLVILDRDGVINYDSDDYIRSPQEWRAIPGSLEAVALLNQANIKVAIASNQSGIARGYFSEATLMKIHEKMHGELALVAGHIDQIFYCPHGPKDHCECRKPKPGMLLQAFKYFNIKPEAACFVGDSQRDLDAGSAAGCDAVRVSAETSLFTFVTTLLGKKS